MTITGAHASSAADSIGGLISLFFHPQRRVYGIWMLWFVSCIFFGVPYGGLPWFHMFHRIFFALAVLVSSVGALPKWKNRGIVSVIIGLVMVFVGTFAGQYYHDIVWLTSFNIIYILIVSPIITAGYILSVFGILCIGYHVHENRESRLNSKSLALILLVVSSVLIFVPIFYRGIYDIFWAVGLFEDGVWYSPGAFPYSLLNSLNALYLVTLVIVVLFSASILYGIVDKKVGVLLFLVGIILFNLPVYSIFGPSSILSGFNWGVSLMAIGSVWAGAPFSALKHTSKIEDIESIENEEMELNTEFTRMRSD